MHAKINSSSFKTYLKKYNIFSIPKDEKELKNEVKKLTQTIKELDYEGFLKFWGFFPYQNEDLKEFRKSTFKKLYLS